MTDHARVERTKTFPLNSRRLTASVVSRIAKELGLEISASLEDTRQVVSGKITEMGRQPQNVQVDLVESGSGVVITLRDDEGVFLMSQPEDREDEGGDDAVSMRNAVGVGGGRVSNADAVRVRVRT